jgi:hypothetical protein
MKTMKEITHILYRRLFQVPVGSLKQIKRGRYEVTVPAFPNRRLILSLLKDGKVKTMTDIGTYKHARVRNIHLTVITNTLNIPIGVKKADVYGISAEGAEVHEEILITAEIEAAVRAYIS